MSCMIAVDTNILVYACDQREPARQAVARELLASITDGVLLWQVACEYIAASRKLAACGFSAQDAWENLGDLLTILRMVTPSPNMLGTAREIHMTRGVSFWDSMLVAGCIDAGVQRLYSEDLPGCSIAGLEILNPFLSSK